MNKKELQKCLFEVNDKVNELTKEVHTKAESSYVTSIHKCVDELYKMFADKFPTSPKTVIANCKKCGHATIHLIKITCNDRPSMTTCLNCGSIWETTTKNVTEIKEIKKNNVQ